MDRKPRCSTCLEQTTVWLRCKTLCWLPEIKNCKSIPNTLVGSNRKVEWCNEWNYSSFNFNNNGEIWIMNLSDTRVSQVYRNVALTIAFFEWQLSEQQATPKGRPTFGRWARRVRTSGCSTASWGSSGDPCGTCPYSPSSSTSHWVSNMCICRLIWFSNHCASKPFSPPHKSFMGAFHLLVFPSSRPTKHNLADVIPCKSSDATYLWGNKCIRCNGSLM